MIIGLHHAALSVTDLDRAIHFYCDVLGMEELATGPFGGEVMERIMRLPGARGRSALVRAGSQHLELFEFADPKPNLQALDRPVNDHGITHFCVLVSDVFKEYERLLSAGVEFHCPPQQFGHMYATYVRDPDGNVFELLEIRAHEEPTGGAVA